MVAKPSPMTTEAIALTEKKMDMSLDDIIKMSKKPKAKQNRAPNKRGGFLGPSRDNFRVQKFMESRSSLRQAALAKRRSKFQDNHFPKATEAARKAFSASVTNRGYAYRRTANRKNIRVAGPAAKKEGVSEGAFNVGKIGQQKQRPRTLDSLFANLKEQRMQQQQQQQQIQASNFPPRYSQRQQGQQWGRGRGDGSFRAQNGRAGNRYTR